MGRPLDCAELIHQGLSPSRISEKLGISPSSVIQYLYVAIGKELIYLSDIVLTIPFNTRSAIEKILAENMTDNILVVYEELKNLINTDISQEEVKFYLRHRGNIIGDLYFFLSDLERTLHSLVKTVLRRHFQETADSWWEKGVSERIKVNCVGFAKNKVLNAEEYYNYTTFNEIRVIINDNWSIFKDHLPEPYASNMQFTMTNIAKANAIRNDVMHPVRGHYPSDEEFKTVKKIRHDLSGSSWILIR